MQPQPLDLNARAARLAEPLAREAAALRIEPIEMRCGAQLFDFGVRALGGWEAGGRLAEICLAGLGRVSLVPAAGALPSSQTVCVQTDQPLAACLFSQYAGRQVAGDKFFAMGSGPLRLLAGGEPLFERHPEWRRWRAESPEEQVAVGVLETSRLPPEEVTAALAESCGVAPDRLLLLAARTASLAGTFQVTARSVETALHKLHELGFDVGRVVSGFGAAPLPPVAADDLTAIGWTNDSILYGAEVTLWLHADDAELAELGPRVPSEASADYGRPFAEIFREYDGDFYRIDPLLFSPARITFVNLANGRTHSFGRLRPEILAASWQG